MGSMLENMYENLSSGTWVELDPQSCPCRGRGWHLSDLDTWHHCRIHGKGVPHPEDVAAQRDADDVRVYREAYARYGNIFIKHGKGTKQDFIRLTEEACLQARDYSPLAWCAHAEMLVQHILEEG